MSSNLMSTETGGESTQYESIQTTEQPHKKSTGQLGNPSTQTTSNPSNTTDAAEHNAQQGAHTAEKIRYGQGISEHGMGGTTTDNSGEGAREGFGRVTDQQQRQGEANSGADERTAEGYGKGNDIGA